MPALTGVWSYSQVMKWTQNLSHEIAKKRPLGHSRGWCVGCVLSPQGQPGVRWCDPLGGMASDHAHGRGWSIAALTLTLAGWGWHRSVRP